MGIVNITPDSFFSGSRKQTDKAILALVEKHLRDGATFIDIGGYSSRPGASNISVEEEKKRVLNAIEITLKTFPDALISIDTFRSEIADKAINIGAALINDISAGDLDKDMFATVKKHQVPYIIMHMKGTPQTMQTNPTYENVSDEVFLYLSEKINQLKQLGVSDIIADPGFGFSKTTEQNFKLLKNLDQFHALNTPILAGLSRKSMIWKSLNTSPEEALNGTTALNTVALLKNVKLLRTHDVKEAVECIKLLNLMA